MYGYVMMMTYDDHHEMVMVVMTSPIAPRWGIRPSHSHETFRWCAHGWCSWSYGKLGQVVWVVMSWTQNMAMKVKRLGRASFKSTLVDWEDWKCIKLRHVLVSVLGVAVLNGSRHWGTKWSHCFWWSNDIDSQDRWWLRTCLCINGGWTCWIIHVIVESCSIAEDGQSCLGRSNFPLRMNI